MQDAIDRMELESLCELEEWEGVGKAISVGRCAVSLVYWQSAKNRLVKNSPERATEAVKSICDILTYYPKCPAPRKHLRLLFIV